MRDAAWRTFQRPDEHVFRVVVRDPPRRAGSRFVEHSVEPNPPERPPLAGCCRREMHPFGQALDFEMPSSWLRQIPLYTHIPRTTSFRTEASV